MRSLVPLSWLALGLLGCSDPSGNAVTDAGLDGAPADGGADASGPPAPVELLWEREVLTTEEEDPRVFALAVLPSGVVMLGYPELVLLSHDGEELGRAPTPMTGEEWLRPGPILVRANGDLTVLYSRGIGSLVIESYDGASLARQWMVEIPDGTAPGSGGGTAALAERDGFVVVTWRDMLSDPESMKLASIDESGALQQTLPLDPPMERLGVRREGHQVPSGDLIYCSDSYEQGTGPFVETVTISPATGRVEHGPVRAPDGAGCSLSRIGDTLVLTWAELCATGGGPCLGLALFDLSGAPTAEPRLSSVYGGGTRVHDMGDQVAVMTTGSRQFHPMQKSDWLPLPRRGLVLQPGEDIYGSGTALGGDGAHFYAAVAAFVGLGPVTVRVQRLAPLSQ
jgi:hypothetical protein